MQCPQCQFENMPGRDRCFKCGSILDAKDAAINVHPPRMAPWKGPVRGLMCRLRRSRLMPEEIIGDHAPKWMKSMPQGSLPGLILSIIPGLAHMLEGRFKEIRWYVLAWFLVLLIGMFMYGSFWGISLVGLAVGLHAYIAIHHRLIKEKIGFWEKLALVAFVLITLAIIYLAVPRLPFIGVRGAHCSMAVPYHRVEPGDYLLARRGRFAPTSLSRGSLVLIRVRTLRGGGWAGSLGRTQETVGQVIGLPGEQLVIADRAFFIENQPLDPNKYPVPRWLQSGRFSVTIDANSYFVSSEYSLRARGRGLDSSLVGEACLFAAERIEARVFMRWWPLSRRGFIREIQ
ncbi:MAG: hypothetical protein JSU94_20285 [Phycisphaerales bacterium]|nr:MAG: hypothetical protein JSU94_20285 [Phycisphaerales bacterium]